MAGRVFASTPTGWIWILICGEVRSAAEEKVKATIISASALGNMTWPPRSPDPAETVLYSTSTTTDRFSAKYKLYCTDVEDTQLVCLTRVISNVQETFLSIHGQFHDVVASTLLILICPCEASPGSDSKCFSINTFIHIRHFKNMMTSSSFGSFKVQQANIN